MTDNSEIRFLGDLQRLDLKPCDRLVLTVDDHVSPEAAERIRDSWNRLGLDGGRLIILDKGMKLGTISAEPKEPA